MRAPRKPQPPHPAPPTGPRTKDTTFRLQSSQKGKDARTAAPHPLSSCPPPEDQKAQPEDTVSLPPSRPQQEERHRRLRAQEHLFPGSSQHPSLGPPSQGQRRTLLRTSVAPRGRCSRISAPPAVLLGAPKPHSCSSSVTHMPGPRGTKGPAGSYPPAQSPGSSHKCHREPQTAGRVHRPPPSQGWV